MSSSLKLKLIVICGAIALDYIITTIMTFVGIDASLYGNYLTFWNALVIFWLVLPQRMESPIDNI